MDPVSEIKARLPIEELVRQYCQLHKKGRNFISLCPFHNDTHPSFLISPDKGIAYCFACQNGGDIFSFYQKIEHVEFPQAIKDLAEKVGLQLPEEGKRGPDKDEKERARACLEEAQRFYEQTLKTDEKTKAYLLQRGVSEPEQKEFGLGVAPDSFSATYDMLLKKGHSRSDIVRSGMAVQKSVGDDHSYDRFRHRLMFPIHDAQGRMIGFGGRTLGNDDAKYLNTSDSPLFHKSQVLFNLHRAKEAMRKTESVIVVEGYFDALAVYRVGLQNVVATCGTALTPDHAKLLKRTVSKIVLCMDTDRAGRDAAERAFLILAPEGLQVSIALLPQKDPADLAVSDPGLLKNLLESGGTPYIDVILEELSKGDTESAAGKREALERLKPLLQALSTEVERSHYREAAATTLRVSKEQLERDLQADTKTVRNMGDSYFAKSDMFSSAEIALGLLLLYPDMRDLLKEVIPPEETFALQLFDAMQAVQADQKLSLDTLGLPPDQRERASILLLFCEQNGFGNWSELHAPREIRGNIVVANRELLRRKQRDIGAKLLAAQRGGKRAEEELLRTQYQQLLKLANLAR